ncbi:peptidoglycan DD-metalloendopeptidase family protein [Massilia sp. R2A-15]|uniref:peptidoglycan DD-metalloendopeptidase family protein n=1 Tax=Massilia sp. R2A-15 TaxID=3064278 RepID=UPI002734EE62|nr:peptidoglycan DD-metalloendopeptidase family protein [Massilia sp. R2A-15]WLI87608.1 peptidoglycan DD-metalloendopeptidase family protein [Massilia sp. R2A-15]
MKQTSPLALLTLTVCLLSACSTASRRAPIIDRAPAPVAARPAPVVADEQKEEARGSYVVRRGDTLLRIALDHGLNYRDVVAWNRLANPDDIKVDQVLRLTAPEHVAGAIQTAPVTMPEIRPAAPKKTAPRGEKKSNSDSALADAKKDDDGKPDARPEPKVEKAAVTNPSAGIAPGSIVRADDDEKLSWMWPSDGKIVATFDEGKNKGIDIAGKPGQQVMAAGAGKVMYAGSGIRGYGNLVIVKHSNSLLSAYAHNRTIVVKEGQTVNKGEKIAEMGDSDSDSVKLHFEIRQQGKPVDPSRFLPNR